MLSVIVVTEVVNDNSGTITVEGTMTVEDTTIVRMVV